jgi:hypothetical protein
MSKTPAAALASKPKVGVKAVEDEHEEPSYARGMKPKKAVVQTDFEKHAGWHQVCRKEKHKMIT